MSGRWLFWIIVLDCWSMLSQLTTWTSRLMPVLALYVGERVPERRGVVLGVLGRDELDRPDPLAAAPGWRPGSVPVPVPPLQARGRGLRWPAPRRPQTSSSTSCLSLVRCRTWWQRDHAPARSTVAQPRGGVLGSARAILTGSSSIRSQSRKVGSAPVALVAWTPTSRSAWTSSRSAPTVVTRWSTRSAGQIEAKVRLRASHPWRRR